MGRAAILFGWRPSEFWESTPVEFWALIEAYREANPPRDIGN